MNSWCAVILLVIWLAGAGFLEWSWLALAGGTVAEAVGFVPVAVAWPLWVPVLVVQVWATNGTEDGHG